MFEVRKKLIAKTRTSVGFVVSNPFLVSDYCLEKNALGPKDVIAAKQTFRSDDSFFVDPSCGVPLPPVWAVQGI